MVRGQQRKLLRISRLARQFYQIYPIWNALRSELNWMQYRLLIRIADATKREYYELESALIEHMENFLLELGNGFAFVARLKRIKSGVVFNL